MGSPTFTTESEPTSCKVPSDEENNASYNSSLELDVIKDEDVVTRTPWSIVSSQEWKLPYLDVCCKSIFQFTESTEMDMTLCFISLGVVFQW